MPDFDLDSALTGSQVPVECKHCGEPLCATSYSQLNDGLNVHVICAPCNSEFRWVNDWNLVYELYDGDPAALAVCPECHSRSGRMTMLTKDDRTSILMQTAADTLTARWACQACWGTWQHKFNFVRAEPNDQI